MSMLTFDMRKGQKAPANTCPKKLQRLAYVSMPFFLKKKELQKHASDKKIMHVMPHPMVVPSSVNSECVTKLVWYVNLLYL